MTDFPNYQPPTETARDFAVLVLNERAGRQANFSVPSFVTSAGTEEEALAYLGRLSRGELQSVAPVDPDKDTVLRISEREVCIFHPDAWKGDRMTRAVVGRIQPQVTLR